ncbi:MAG: urease accessory protein UreD [Solirubrobacteraceae bacterium]|nr:urease accessory protein UreD [Solirubrobacteraceae bacterium]
MNGGVRIRTEADAETGRTRIVELSATAPLGVKVTGPEEVHIIGTAAAPLDGDVVTIDLEVGDGTQLTIGTVAATMAWPARGDVSPSVMIVRAKVGEGASLRWLPEQLVPVRGCRHVLRSEVQLAATASVVWREEVILGRSRNDEGPGELDAELRVVRAGVPLLHQQLHLDGSGGAAHTAASLLGTARALGSLLVAGPGAPEHFAQANEPGLRGAVLELEAGGRLASATAASAVDLRKWLEARRAGMAPPAAQPGDEEPPATPSDQQELLSR